MKPFNASNILISLFLVGTFGTINASAPAQQNMDEIVELVQIDHSLIRSESPPHYTLNFTHENGPLLPNMVRYMEITIGNEKLIRPLASQITVTVAAARILKHNTAAKRCCNVCVCYYDCLGSAGCATLAASLIPGCFQSPCITGYVCCNNKTAKKGVFCCYNNNPQFRDDYEENQ